MAEQSSLLEPVDSRCLASLTIKSHVDFISAVIQGHQHKQFFIVPRRNAPLPLILKLWQRQASKSDVTHLLRVHYSGEDGIDSGAILEFLGKMIQDIALAIFP